MTIYFQLHRPNPHFFRPPLLLTTATSVLLPTIHLCLSRTRCSRPSPPNSLAAPLEVREGETKKKKKKNGKLNGSKLKVYESQMKEKWLDSMSCPFDVDEGDVSLVGGEVGSDGLDSEWIVGVDPDTSGAIALLKPDGPGGFSAQVFDTPYLQVLVGKRSRKRPDARAIVLLLQSLGAPLGTIAYIEQSTPFPKDGKQGWWSGGYTYGLWTGVLVASGFSVVPVTSRVWKDRFGLSGKLSNKDHSRETASLMFPSASSSLGRKKDHGRAEALLIAAYGKGIRPPESSSA